MSDEWIERFMESKRTKAESDTFDLSPTTVKNYGSVTNHLLDFMKEREIDDVRGIEPIDIDDFVELHLASRLSGSTVRNYYNSLIPLFDYLVDKNQIEENPMDAKEFSDYQIDDSSPKRSDDEPVYIEPEEKEALMDNVQGRKVRNRLIIQLMWDTGMRASGLCNIKMDHVDREDQSVFLPSDTNKSKSSRTVWYSDDTAFLMDLWLDRGYRNSYAHALDSDYLFMSERGTDLSPKAVNDMIKEAAKEAGLQSVAYEGKAAETDNKNSRTYHKITSHVLRHSYGVQKARSGMPIKQLADLMGHSDTSTTEKYIRLGKKDLRQAAMDHSKDVSIAE